MDTSLINSLFKKKKKCFCLEAQENRHHARKYATILQVNTRSLDLHCKTFSTLKRLIQ